MSSIQLSKIVAGQLVRCVESSIKHNCSMCALEEIDNEICCENLCLAENRADCKNVYFRFENELSNGYSSINLCDSCRLKQPECSPEKIMFASDSQNFDKHDDSVIECSSYHNKNGNISSISEFIESVRSRIGKNAFMHKDSGNEYIAYKLFSEVGEVIGSYAKQKHQNKHGNLIEEIGDCLWYLYAFQIHNGNSFGIPNGVTSTTSIEDVLIDLSRHAGYILQGYAEPINTRKFVQVSVMIDSLMTLCELSGFTYLEAMQKNCEKLDKRHGKGQFNPECYTNPNPDRRVTFGCTNKAEYQSTMCSECNFINMEKSCQ